MKAIAVGLAAAFLAVTAQIASATPTGDLADTPAAPAAVAQERAALRAALAQAQQQDPDGATLSAALKAVLADPTFLSLSDEERHAAHLMYGAVLFDMRRWEDARTSLRVATQMPQAGAFDWELCLRDDFMLRDYVDAAASASELARRWLAQLADFSDDAMYSLAREVERIPGAADATARLLTSLHAARWKPKDPFGDADPQWLALVRIRLEHGDVADAKALAGELVNASTFLKMHADKRFDSVIAADPAHFDVMTRYASELAEVRTAAAAAPDKLAGVVNTAIFLVRLNRPEEALTAVDAALARTTAKPRPFSDYDAKINWVLDERSDALLALGRGDEAIAAIAAMAKGAAHDENGSRINVSQAINLAGVYNAQDRPKDALAAIAALDLSHASAYGRMAAQGERACAYFALGDKENLAKAPDEVKAHAGDGLHPYLNAMLCARDFDRAAQEVIADLDDPVRRIETLYYLQDYLPQTHPTAHDRAIHDAWIAVRGRPDVQAAIAEVGRIESYAIVSPSY